MLRLVAFYLRALKWWDSPSSACCSYELDTAAASGKAPGAVITLNPYVAIAKFALSARDLEQNVKQTAAKIAADVASRVSSAGRPGAVSSIGREVR
jgi:hypothetical protein